MNEVSDDSWGNGVEEPFVLFSQYLGIHGIDLLKSEETQVGSEFKGPSVVDVPVMMMMVMVVLLEIRVLVRHFDESLLVRGEGVRGVMVMALLSLVVCLS